MDSIFRSPDFRVSLWTAGFYCCSSRWRRITGVGRLQRCTVTGLVGQGIGFWYYVVMLYWDALRIIWRKNWAWVFRLRWAAGNRKWPKNCLRMSLRLGQRWVRI